MVIIQDQCIPDKLFTFPMFARALEQWYWRGRVHTIAEKSSAILSICVRFRWQTNFQCCSACIAQQRQWRDIFETLSFCLWHVQSFNSEHCTVDGSRPRAMEGVKALTLTHIGSCALADSHTPAIICTVQPVNVAALADFVYDYHYLYKMWACVCGRKCGGATESQLVNKKENGFLVYLRSFCLVLFCFVSDWTAAACAPITHV